MQQTTDSQSTQLITGVILAGGQGRRMGGQDKGLLEIQGRPLVEYLLESLQPQVGKVIINANRNQERYQQYSVPVISDQLSDYQGPLAGFATALNQVETPWILTVPCDAPRISAELAARMLQAVEDEQAELAVAHDGERLQPVHALLPVKLLPSLQAFLESGERKIDRWYAQHKMAQVDFSDARFMFRNINTPEQKQNMERSFAEPPIIGICAYSGTGKTTLLAQLIPLLKDKGLRLTVIKHGHHKLELDQPGKDSFKFREAGADQVILASSSRVAIMQECQSREEPRLADTLKLVDKECADLILVEGFKHENYPKLEVHRPVLKKPLLFPEDDNVIALICDTPPTTDQPVRSIPQLDLNDPDEIVDFIMDQVVTPSPQPLSRGCRKRLYHRRNPSPQPLSPRERGYRKQALKPPRPQQRFNETSVGEGVGGEGGFAFTTPSHRERELRGEGDKETLLTSPSCADASDPESLPLDTAMQSLMAEVHPLSSFIKRPLRDALDQVLAADIISPLNVPAHTNSAMDGYALAGSELPQDGIREYPVVGTAFAGKPYPDSCPAGSCIRIMTGAIMPKGADTVVMQEQSEAIGTTHVKLGTGHKPGQNVRQAGEDIQQGQTVLSTGRRLTPADIGLLASLGIAEAPVFRPPRVAFFSTGDELRSIGEPLEAGCIYDSNRYTLFSLLQQLGADIIDMGVVPDQPDALENTLREASTNADIVITSGGVSVGEADYIRDILARMGKMNFWKIAIKPGRPLTFGHLDKALFFGLPGNPVAVMVTFHLFVKPALLKLAGEKDYSPLLVNAICQNPLRKKPGRTEFIRAIMQRDNNGQLTVSKAGHQGSGILTSMSRANCFILLPEDNAGVAEGDTVTVQPLGRI